MSSNTMWRKGVTNYYKFLSFLLDCTAIFSLHFQTAEVSLKSDNFHTDNSLLNVHPHTHSGHTTFHHAPPRYHTQLDDFCLTCCHFLKNIFSQSPVLSPLYISVWGNSNNFLTISKFTTRKKHKN